MNSRTNQVVAIVAVIVLIIGAWDLGRKQALNLGGADSSSASESSEASSSDTAGAGKSAEKVALSIGSGEEEVQVTDQTAGVEIKVSSLSLSEAGWVAVRDDDGRVLGAGRFDAGSFENVTVPLLRATVAGDSYQVLLYADDGDRAFDLRKDVLITDPDGSVAGTNFKAL